MKILIATPAYDASVTLEYLASIVQLLDRFRAERPDVRFGIETIAISVVHDARNYFASLVLADPTVTHLLFVDADMGFEPTLIMKLLDEDREVAAASYPKRVLDLARVHRAARQAGDPRLALSRAAEHVGEGALLSPTTTIRVTQTGFTRVSAAGTGIMLIKRSVLERLRDAYPDLWIEAGHPDFRALRFTGGVLQCFLPIRSESGIYASEDLSFCRRWIEGCGGEVWLCLSEAVSHVGRIVVTSRFLDKLEAR